MWKPFHKQKIIKPRLNWQSKLKCSVDDVQTQRWDFSTYWNKLKVQMSPHFAVKCFLAHFISFHWILNISRKFYSTVVYYSFFIFLNSLNSMTVAQSVRVVLHNFQDQWFSSIFPLPTCWWVAVRMMDGILHLYRDAMATVNSSQSDHPEGNSLDLPLYKTLIALITTCSWNNSIY